MILDSHVFTEADPDRIRDLEFVCVFAVGFPGLAVSLQGRGYP